MKNSAEYAKKLNKLCTSLKKNAKDALDPMDSILREPSNILLLGCISEYTTMTKAHTVLRKLRSTFVDYNELRVSRPREIKAALGKSYPKVDETTNRIIELLNAVFHKFDGLEMAGMEDIGKREAQAMIKELDGITPYIYSFFIMYFIEAHAFALNEKMYDVLGKEGIVNPDSDFDDVHGFLERQIAAAKGKEIYIVLRDYIDNYEVQEPKATAKKTAKKTVKKTAKKATEKKVAKKTTKKTTAKKTVKKAAKKTK